MVGTLEFKYRGGKRKSHMHDLYNMKFDAAGIIEFFGGASEIAAVLSKARKVHPKTIQKWRERGNIPADALATLMVHAARNGKNFNPYSFLLERT